MSSFSDLKKRNLLSIESMSEIKGGRMSPTSADNGNGTGTCGYKTRYGVVSCGVSKECALFMAADGGHWCCDSCASSSYCG